MSLHRVGSIETFTTVLPHPRSRRTSDVSAQGRSRKLSFNPLPESWDPPALKKMPAVGAFEVPNWKRVLQVAVAVAYCLFSAGIVFGYAAIKPVLKREGAYSDVCLDGDGLASGDTCVEVHLNFMFTVAAVATNVAALPVGAILDRYGPRVCGLSGSLFLATGSLLMAFEAAVPFDGLLWGYFFLALGGPFIYISTFQLSNAFPRNSGLILALLTGAFDASSAIFLMYRLVYDETGGRLGREKFFLGYLAVPVAIVLVQIVLLPSQSYKTVGEMIEDSEEPIPVQGPSDQVDEHAALLQEERREQRAEAIRGIEELLGSAKADVQARREEKKNDISGVWGIMHNHTAWEQTRSPWFVLICLFTVVQMTRINYFVATIRPQYEALLHSHARAVAVNNFFDLALPLGGILSIPFIGAVLDRTSTVTVLTALVAVATAIGLLGVVPGSEWAAYANIVLFVLYRPFYYTAVSDYTAKVFGFRTFGTVYGAVICTAGLLNFAQSGLDRLFHETFHGDPIPVNLILLSLGFVIGVALVFFVAVRGWQARRMLLEQEAESAFARPAYGSG